MPGKTGNRSIIIVEDACWVASKGSRVQIPAARFSEVWENFFRLKMFAKMRGFGGFAVRGEFAMRFSFGHHKSESASVLRVIDPEAPFTVFVKLRLGVIVVGNSHQVADELVVVGRVKSELSFRTV